MPPVKTQVACPNCRLPVPVTLEQLFDVTQDPGAKRRFLSGRFNLIQCPNCRYQGQASTPLLYHDNEKELLISFVPMELALPQPEQEKIIGRLMNEAINKLPQEKRKGYLLNPRPALTLQGMMDRILEADGVTREMMDAQRAKAQLLQQLLATPEEQLPEMARQNDAQLDAAFFQLVAASAEAQAAEGNEAGARRLLDLQNKLIPHTTIGARARQRQEMLEGTVRELQGLGDKLTPDKLLDLVTAAADDEKLAAYASLMRPAMDYAFFEALTKRVDRATGDEKTRLAHNRDLLLEITKEIDQAAQVQVKDATELLRTLLETSDLEVALQENAGRIDETFMAVLNANLEAAQKQGRPDVVQRLRAVHEAIVDLMQESAPPEVRFINELLQLESDAAAEAELKRRPGEVTQQLLDAMIYITDNLRQSGQPELAARLEKLQEQALGQVMDTNWKKQ